MLPIKFRLNLTYNLGDVVYRFLRWRPSCIKEWNNLSNSESLCRSDASHQVSAQSDLYKIDFRDSGQGGHIGFPIRTILAIFDLLGWPGCFLPNFKSTGLLFQENERKVDFQDGSHSGQLEFQIKTILAIFDLQVTLMLPTKFQINLPFSSGEEVKDRRSRWQTWWPSWIQDQNDFSYF